MGPKKSTVIAAKPKPKMTIKKRGKPMDKKMLGAGAAVAVALLAGVFWPTGGPPKSKLRSKKATPTKRKKYEIPYEYQKPPEGECQLSIMDARQVIKDASELLKTDRPAAFAKLQETIECGPRNVGEVKVNTALFRARGGEHAEAVKLFDDMWSAVGDEDRVDLGEAGLDAYVNALLKLEKLEEAAAVLKKALALPADGDDAPKLASTLCFTLATLGRATEGLPFLPEELGGGRTEMLAAICRGVAAQEAGGDGADEFEMVKAHSSWSVADQALAWGGAGAYAAVLARARAGTGDVPPPAADYAPPSGDSGGWATPKLNETPETVDRRAGLTLESFTSEYVVPEKPVLLGGGLLAAMQPGWTKEALAAAPLGDESVFVHDSSMTAARRAYSFMGWVEEQPFTTLRDFVHFKMDVLAGEAPYVLERNEELVELLNTESPALDALMVESERHDIAEEERAAMALVAVGGPGSGATFHVQGAAYHALAYGATRWFLFPPVSHYPEGGVHAFADRLDAGNWPFPKPLECVQRPGEVLYVPTGWHQAHVNLAESAALNVQLATPTHVPLDRDWSQHGDPESGAAWEFNWKTLQVRTEPEEEEDDEATEATEAPAQVPEFKQAE